MKIAVFLFNKYPVAPIRPDRHDNLPHFDRFDLSPPQKIQEIIRPIFRQSHQ
jgi:hypothetical protein